MKNKIFLFIVCLALLLVFQAKVVMPLVYDIVASDLFLEDTGDEFNPRTTTSLMTESAYMQCNNHIANEFFLDSTIAFSKHPLNAFHLGAYQYLVNADIEITPADNASYTRRYACRIKYLKGDDTSMVSEAENWSVYGISGLDDN